VRFYDAQGWGSATSASSCARPMAAGTWSAGRAGQHRGLFLDVLVSMPVTSSAVGALRGISGKPRRRNTGRAGPCSARKPTGEGPSQPPHAGASGTLYLAGEYGTLAASVTGGRPGNPRPRPTRARFTGLHELDGAVVAHGCAPSFRERRPWATGNPIELEPKCS